MAGSERREGAVTGLSMPFGGMLWLCMWVWSAGDHLAIGKETARRLGMGTNMYPSSALLGQHPDPDIVGMDVDELIEQADGFAGVFPGEPLPGAPLPAHLAHPWSGASLIWCSGMLVAVNMWELNTLHREEAAEDGATVLRGLACLPVCALVCGVSRAQV